jgi:hypothetical protein
LAAAKYFTGKPCVRGHIAERFEKTGICVECNREKAAARRQTHPEESRAYVQAAWQKYAERYREGHNRATREWRAANPEQAKAIRDRAAKKLGRAYWRAAQSKRRAAEQQRIPPWADLQAISRIYAACPEGHHVDHVIPLRGPTVSGLHVETNLQYLPAKANQQKSNKFEQ